MKPSLLRHRKWWSCGTGAGQETGEGLAPTAEQSKDHAFPGFVGWNLLIQDMLQCEAKGDCSSSRLTGIVNEAALDVWSANLTWDYFLLCPLFGHYIQDDRG
jgi:hypothetical protein